MYKYIKSGLRSSLVGLKFGFPEKKLYIPIYMYVCIYIHTCIYMYTQIYMCEYIQVHNTYIHTYTHAHTVCFISSENLG